MIYYNKQSKRTNPFQSVYSNVNKRPKKISIFPSFVDIELTNYCNLNCRMCPRSLSERKEGFMCNNLFRKVAKECKQFNTPVRLIGWGEPLLHPEICEFVRYIKQKENQLLHITTNGLAFKAKDMSTIIKNRVDSIIFSLQGANARQYQDMRRIDRYYIVKDVVQRFIQKRGNNKLPFIQVSTTTTTETKKEKEQFVNEWLPLVDAVSIGKTNMSFFELNPTKKYVPCTEVYHQIQVDYDGKVSPCCGDFDNYLTIGNAFWESIYNIWNKSKKLNCIRELLKNKNHRMLTLCSQCFPTYEEID